MASENVVFRGLLFGSSFSDGIPTPRNMPNPHGRSTRSNNDKERVEECAVVTGNLVVPIIYDSRKRVKGVTDDQRKENTSLSGSVTGARSCMLPCALALFEDLTNRWGEGEHTLTATMGGDNNCKGSRWSSF